MNSIRAPKWDIEGNRIYPYLYLLPALALFAVFLLYPIVFSFNLSFQEWDGFAPMDQAKYVGLENYRTLMADKTFRMALKNTIFFVIGSVGFQTVLGFILAFALYYFVGKRTARTLRAIYFAPCVLSFVMVGITWARILDFGGPPNQLLDLVGLGSLKRPWLSTPNLVMWLMVWVDSWQWTGYSMVIFYAGLMTIPVDLLEAAQIDGADPLQMVWHVVLPLMRKVTIIVVVLSTIGGFKIFDIIFVMTRGGPAHLSEVLTTYMYYFSFLGLASPHEMGTGAAIAVILVAIVFTFSVLRLRLAPREE